MKEAEELRKERKRLKRKTQEVKDTINNRTLRRFVELYYALHTHPPEPYIAKRGKKTTIPIGQITDILKVSPETARSYCRVFECLELINDIDKNVKRTNELKKGENVEG